MKVTCRYEIPKDAYEHTNGDVGEHVANMIVRKLCEKIADIVANGEEYIFRMTPQDILENTYKNALQYQRYVLYEPLIRCKDCRHRDLFSCPLADNDFQKDDDFCSWGERREP